MLIKGRDTGVLNHPFYIKLEKNVRRKVCIMLTKGRERSQETLKF